MQYNICNLITIILLLTRLSLIKSFVTYPFIVKYYNKWKGNHNIFIIYNNNRITNYKQLNNNTIGVSNKHVISRNNYNSSLVSVLNEKSKEFLSYPSNNLQYLLVLVGISGSGKSTFSNRIVNTVNRSESKRKWVSYSQDALKSRQRVYERSYQSLLQGDSVIIDRCNFDNSQRKNWIDLYNSLDNKNEVICFCIVMPNANNIKICTSRAIERGVDEMHPTVEDWSIICRRQSKSFEYPNDNEGFHYIYFCQNNEDLDYLINKLSK